MLPEAAPSARVGHGGLASRGAPTDGPQTLRQRPAVRARLSLPWGSSYLQRPRSAHEPSGPAPLRDALSPWHARCRPSRHARHGFAVEFPPLRGSHAPRRPDSSLAVPRPQWLRVSPQLAPQPAHRLLHGRAKTMNHEIRWNQDSFGITPFVTVPYSRRTDATDARISCPEPVAS